MNNDSAVISIIYLLLYIIYYGAQVIAAIFIVRAVRRNNRRRASQNNTRGTVTNANNISPVNHTVASSTQSANRIPVNVQVVEQPTNSNDSFGPVNYFANARHNQTDKWFKFEYKRENGVWLTYILRMPSLNGRDGNAHITHRYSGGGRYWICYDPQPRTLKDAQIISRVWADRELEYIATGVSFERQVW